jgi:hypothetical protein
MAAPIFPPGVSPRQFDLATAEFAKAIGSDWVLASDADRDSHEPQLATIASCLARGNP